MTQINKTIVVLGDRAAGKSAVVHRLIDEAFDFDSYKPTIDECYNVVWKAPDGQYLQIQLIDTAAWNEFPAMQSLYIKMAHLVLVVFDVVSPTWRDSLLSVINGVRSVKADADIFIVGNKCDKLKKTDAFSVASLSEVIGHSCVGQVLTSALTLQGILGLKHLLLCSKSQLTEGHYSEAATLPKKKKITKKLNGLALAINFNKKAKEEEKSRIKYREQVVYPQEPHYIQYHDLTHGNFDKLFDAASKLHSTKRTDHNHNLPGRTLEKARRCKTDTSYNERRKSLAEQSSFTSDYGSGTETSPSSSYDISFNKIRPFHHRQSVDYTAMRSARDNPEMLFMRQKSSSAGNGIEKRLLDLTLSSSTITSESSADSSSLKSPLSDFGFVEASTSSVSETKSGKETSKSDFKKSKTKASNSKNLVRGNSISSQNVSDKIKSKDTGKHKKSPYDHSRHKSDGQLIKLTKN